MSMRKGFYRVAMGVCCTLLLFGMVACGKQEEEAPVTPAVTSEVTPEPTAEPTATPNRTWRGTLMPIRPNTTT